MYFDLGEYVLLCAWHCPFFTPSQVVIYLFPFLRNQKAPFLITGKTTTKLTTLPTYTYQQLSWLPSSQTVEANVDVMVRFVATLYYKKKTDQTVNGIRFQLYVHSASDNLRDGLNQHVLRSAYQSSWVWGNTISILHKATTFKISVGVDRTYLQRRNINTYPVDW